VTFRWAASSRLSAASRSSASVCRAAGPAANFRSPSSVWFASTEALAPMFVPSTATVPTCPIPVACTAEGPARTGLRRSPRTAAGNRAPPRRSCAACGTPKCPATAPPRSPATAWPAGSRFCNSPRGAAQRHSPTPAGPETRAPKDKRSSRRLTSSALGRLTGYGPLPGHGARREVLPGRIISRSATVAACRRCRWAVISAASRARVTHGSAAGSTRDSSSDCQADG
jgi:hypothetical protein